jgi:hypothetical protein
MAMFVIAMSLIAMLVTGCGTLKSGQIWGKDATLCPGLDRIGRSALRAALEPATLIPAAGAIVFIIDDFDEKVSDWAMDENPVFGSRTIAGDASDILLGSLGGSTLITIGATPGGDKGWEWVRSKAKGLAVEGVALGVAGGAMEALKCSVHRTRPDREDDQSFPSGHATIGFSLASLTSRNLDSISLPAGLRTGLKGLTYSAAATLAWARVEAGRHFPSDVLAGAAISHFLTAFVHDAFLGLPEDRDLFCLEIMPVEKGAFLSFGWSF